MEIKEQPNRKKRDQNKKYILLLKTKLHGALKIAKKTPIMFKVSE